MSTTTNKRPSTSTSRKSKKARTAPSSAPLGSLLSSKAVLVKEESELELEEAVFGRTSRDRGKGAWDEDDVGTGGLGGFGAESDEDADEQDDEETGLERLRDENLFFVDVPPTASTSLTNFESVFPPSDSSSSSASEDDEPAQPIAIKSKNRRQAVWYDPADEQLTVSLKDVARLRKLRVDPGEDVVGGLEYENRLRRQFEKMHPVPAWVVDARRKVVKRKAIAEGRLEANGSDDDEGDAGSESEKDDEDEVDDLFRKAGGKRRGPQKGLLEAGEIDIDRVRDANQAEASSGVVSIGFHPRAQVLFSASKDRRLRLFQIDGTENALLQTIHIPQLPITTAAFHPSGSSILLTGNVPFFMSYDLQSGAVVQSPRGLLTGGLGGSDRAATGGQGGMERFKFSPDGEVLAVGGRRGYVHLVDWGSSGMGKGGQVFGEVKMNVAVKGIAWQREGKELVTLGEDSEVYVWDVGTRKCITRWKDDGGFGAAGLEIDAKGQYSAVSSSTGIVNLYEPNSQPSTSGAERKALKAIGNLTTAVTSMKFNHDSQLLAIASRTNKDQLKLVHLPSATVYANWPTQQTPLHHVTAVDFSRGSEWLAVGNARGKVLLYTLKGYAGRR